MTGLILNLTVGVIFFLSGILKLLSVRRISDSLVDATLMPSRMKIIIEKLPQKTISILFSIFEIWLSVMLILNDYTLLINGIAILIVFLFIFINLKSIKEKTIKKCYCFGDYSNSVLGYGGLTLNIILSLCLLPAIIFESKNLIELLEYNYKIFMIVIIIALLLMAIIMILRNLIDKLTERLIL